MISLGSQHIQAHGALGGKNGVNVSFCHSRQHKA